MVSEMTGNYSLLVPSMVSVVLAYFLAGNSYIYENQVNTRAESPAHKPEYVVPLLEKIRIADAMVTNPITASSYMLVTDLVKLMKSNGIDVVPVIDSGRLTGVVANLDIARLSDDKWLKRHIREIMSKKLVVGYADETLHESLIRMTKNNISHLPIVNPNQPDKIVGFLAIHNIVLSYDLQKKTIFG
jgi:chloride channel protein, CIC family